jgi:hypothetical protein
MPGSLPRQQRASGRGTKGRPPGDLGRPPGDLGGRVQ